MKLIKNLVLALFILAILTPLVHASVKGRTNDGAKTVEIQIADDNGIHSYYVFKDDGSYTLEKRDTVNCSKSETVSLAPHYAHNSHVHKVIYTSCGDLGGIYIWSLKSKFTQNFQDAEPILANINTATVTTHSMVVTDMNGDSLADLIVSDGTEKQVSVMLGNGDGSLQAPIVSNYSLNKDPIEQPVFPTIKEAEPILLNPVPNLLLDNTFSN